MRPILRPGTHVLRRDRRELQVGLDPRAAVVLPDDQDSRSSLALLARCAPEQEYGASQTLDALREHGLVLDGDILMPLIPWCPTRPGGATRGQTHARLARHEAAAIARRAGDEGSTLLRARTRCRVAVEPFADTPDGLLRGELTSSLDHAGIEVQTVGSVDTASREEPSAAMPTLVALVGAGEPQRELVDRWMRAGVPHLLVRLSEGAATVGPFVVPGRTACLRCVDAHHTDADPAWPLLVRQYATACTQDRADGVPEPVDSLLARLALAWAGRDIASYAEGSRPSTWSTTIRFDPQLSSLETRSWLRHPDCGCGWA